MKTHVSLLCLATLCLAACQRMSVPKALDPRAAALAKEVRGLGWIAFGARSEKGDWDLFAMRPDGSDRRNLTNTPDYSEAAPRFSPDGRKLLYRRLARDKQIDGNRYGMQGSLVIANADGSNPQVWGADGEFPWASWSPDGTQIACLAPKGISIVDLATRQTVRTLDRKGIFQQLGWSPDGKSLAGVANIGEVWTIVRMDAVTGAVNPVHEYQNCTPHWFPAPRRRLRSTRKTGSMWRSCSRRGRGRMSRSTRWRVQCVARSERSFRFLFML